MINLTSRSIKIVTESGRIIVIPPDPEKKYELIEEIVSTQFVENGVPIFFKNTKVILPKQEEDEIFIIPKNIVRYLDTYQRSLNIVYPDGFVTNMSGNIIGFRGLTAVSWTTTDELLDNENAKIITTA